MNITKRGEKARELFLEGYNCTQSVAGAYADMIGLPFDTLMKLALPFGAGMGRMREVCGAFSGMMFVVGMLYGDTEHDKTIKSEVYKRVQELAEKFKAEKGSIICREILELKKGENTEPNRVSERTEQYYKSRPCAEVCAVAASILEEYIDK